MKKPGKNTQRIISAFGQTKKGGNAGFLFSDQMYGRDFREQLGLWMEQEGFASDMPGFLKRIGLAEAIRAEELQDVYTGVAVPSPRLSTLLSVAMPGQALRPDAEATTEGGQVDYHSMYAFRREAERLRRAEPAAPMVDIEDNIFDDFSAKVIRSIRVAVEARKTPAQDGKDEETKTDLLPLHQQMMTVLESLATQHEADMAELLEGLFNAYHKDRFSTLQDLSALFQSRDILAEDQQITAFLAMLEQQIAASPGQALRFLRQSHGLSLLQLGKTLDVTYQAIGYRELLSCKPWGDDWFGKMVRRLHLGDAVTEEYALLVAPKLVERAGVGWLHTKIENNEWELLSFPALDEEWLAAQPEDKRAGLYLRALRQKAGLSTEQVAKTLKVNTATITRWEIGTRCISPNKLGSLIESLSPTLTEAVRLVQLAYPDLLQHMADHPQWLQQQIEAKSWENINYPALDAVWLDAQPEKKRAGLYLKALRECKGYTPVDLAEVLGVTNGLVSNCENSSIAISKKYWEGIQAALRPVTETHSRFPELAEISNQAIAVQLATARAEKRAMKNATTASGAAHQAASVPELLPENKELKR